MKRLRAQDHGCRASALFWGPLFRHLPADWLEGGESALRGAAALVRFLWPPLSTAAGTFLRGRGAPRKDFSGALRVGRNFRQRVAAQDR
jgi:hypothetical protein